MYQNAKWCTKQPNPTSLDATEPAVFEVTFADGTQPGDGDAATGAPLESDQPMRLLATTADGETTFDVELEATDDGSYATVQPFADEGDWELRVTGGPDGTFVSEWVDATVGLEGDGHDHDHDHEDHEEHDGHHHQDHAGDDSDHEAHDHSADDQDTTASPFTAAHQFGAVAVAIVGTLAVTVESLRLRDRRV